MESSYTDEEFPETIEQRNVKKHKFAKRVRNRAEWKRAREEFSNKIQESKRISKIAKIETNSDLSEEYEQSGFLLSSDEESSSSTQADIQDDHDIESIASDSDNEILQKDFAESLGSRWNRSKNIVSLQDFAMYITSLQSVYGCTEATVIDIYDFIKENFDTIAYLGNNGQLPKKFKTLKRIALKRIPNIFMDISYKEKRDDRYYDKVMLERPVYPLKTFKNITKFAVSSVLTYIKLEELVSFVKKLHPQLGTPDNPMLVEVDMR